VDNVSSLILRIEEEIKEIRRSIKEDINELKKRIDEVEENFRREYRSLRDRISDLEHNYEGIAIAKVGARMTRRLRGPIAYPPIPPMTFAEDSTCCDEYKIATYREKTGLL